MKVLDFRKVQKSSLILVVEDVYETRAGIDSLLKANGYRVVFGGAESEAINSTRSERPDLILLSGAVLPNNVLGKVDHTRKEAAVGEEVPVVVFCAQDVPEGEEVAMDGNVYLTNPDNFNQLRSLVARLLLEPAHGNVTHTEDQTPEFIKSNKSRGPFVVRFMDTRPRMLMEITNTAASTLKSVEILTVFLKDQGTSTARSPAHIRFDPIKSVQPNEKAVVSHRTWINGSPASDEQDQIARLQVVAGAATPYVLDISWEDVDGKTQFQRIPVGH